MSLNDFFLIWIAMESGFAAVAFADFILCVIVTDKRIVTQPPFYTKNRLRNRSLGIQRWAGSLTVSWGGAVGKIMSSPMVLNNRLV